MPPPPRMSLKMKMKMKKKKARRPAENVKLRGPKLQPEQIDYKDVATLQRLCSAQGKLFSRKRSGLEAAAQRRVSVAVRRARFMALLPYVS
jgi:small subunit ribosomal protein S18